MNILKQSTAATVKLGAFVDDTDGKTAETGLTISQADIRLSKNGGDFAQTNNATGATHDEFGYYDIPLDTTDANTLGRLRVAVSVSGALPVWQVFLVVTANVYDTLCSTDTFDVNVATIARIAGDVWSYAKRTLTHPSVSAEEPEDSNTLILYRDADIAIELTDLTIPAGAKKYIFTIKDNLDSGDDQAVLQASYAIDGSEVETNTLVYINSAAAPVLTNPVTFTLTDTNITIDLTAEAAALLPRYERGYLNWDLKLVTDASVTIVLQGLAQIIGTSTRAIE